MSHERLWELREETLNACSKARSYLITTGEREVVQWLGSITVPRLGHRIVMREATEEKGEGF